jgi:hypothetical protein
MDPTTKFGPEQKPDAVQGVPAGGDSLADALPLQPERFPATTGGYSPDASNGAAPSTSAPITGGLR